MPVEKLKELLEQKGIRYELIPHPATYTAQGTAAAAHVPGKEMAKTVIIRVDGNLAMALLPAAYHMDLVLFRKQADADEVRLAREEEFSHIFPNCETGAQPPFGNLYGLTVYADEALAQDEYIAFNAGSHRELMRLRWADFVELVKPTVLAFAAVPAFAAGWEWR